LVRQWVFHLGYLNDDAGRFSCQVLSGCHILQLISKKGPQVRAKKILPVNPRYDSAQAIDTQAIDTSARARDPIAEAKSLQTKLARIDRREITARANMEERYQAERNELLRTASPVVLRIIAAASGEADG
jgi:hypothetical protein